MRDFSSTLEPMDTVALDPLRRSDGLELAGLARRYCDLIDGSTRDGSPWLRHVAGLLPRLQAAVSSVQVPVSGQIDTPRVDLDERFELFSRLRTLLADRDAYWLEFDQTSDGTSGMTGSLADDLTDIYCELKSGLRLHPLVPERALATWAHGFECHWCRHLIDAERHLAQLAAQGRLDA
jgi:hypothetical protein